MRNWNERQRPSGLLDVHPVLPDAVAVLIARHEQAHGEWRAVVWVDFNPVAESQPAKVCSIDF